MGTVFGRGVTNDLWVGNSSRIEAGFVSTGIEQAPHIVHRAHTAAHGEGNKHLRGDCFNDVEHHIPVVTGGGDVKEGELICTLIVVAGRNFHGVACVSQLYKVDALDDSAARDIQAGNDAFGQHGLLLPQFVCSSLRCSKIQIAGIDGAAANHTFHALIFNSAQGFNVGHAAQTT